MTAKLVLSNAFLLATATFPQQTPTAAAVQTPRPPQAPLQIPDPHYDTVSLTIEVNAPVDQVWARVGKYCDIGEWYPLAPENACKYLAGDGEMGTVRSVVNEVMVGKTQYSYTYTQAPRENTPYNLYHGTMEAVPVTATTSRLNYVLFFDTSMLAADAREKSLKDRETGFNQRLRNMKILAEGGKLPAAEPIAAPRPTAGGAPAAPYLSSHPHYIAVPMQIEINAPVDKVWSYIGHYCDLAKLGAAGFPSCTITSGKDGEYGAVRSIGREVLVGKTRYSYTYTQPLRATGFYPLYHGTVEARAITPRTTTLYWTLVYDNSNLDDDAAKEKDIASRRTRFNAMLQNVKILSEGGTLPPEATAKPTAVR